MNKKKANELAKHNDKPWSFYINLMTNSPLDMQMRSTLNSYLTRGQAKEVLLNTIKHRRRSEVPQGLQYSAGQDKYFLSADGLIIQNILREFA